ncbi:unnamed protein product [Mycetohabitans rhizoxinica HKI 454]|uniref:Uncharacterized protein n=1 Tax=Mycetohabitans rhizoxinica (strain DSM 19002 / CIP 109453 / HKI 454) TaxID=882378 RepID=E5AKI6_MYCRK|nr:unnamed protein product [Mycetohabitans rhizoxinica HKI 454]
MTDNSSSLAVGFTCYGSGGWADCGTPNTMASKLPFSPSNLDDSDCSPSRSTSQDRRAKHSAPYMRNAANNGHEPALDPMVQTKGRWID